MRSLLTLLLSLVLSTVVHAQSGKDSTISKGVTGLGDFISKTSFNILNNTDAKQTIYASYDKVEWTPLSVKPNERKLLTVGESITLYIGIINGMNKRYYPIHPATMYVLTDSANLVILKTVQ